MILEAEVLSIIQYSTSPAFLALDYIVCDGSVEGRVFWQNDGCSGSDLEWGATLRADQPRVFNTQCAYAHRASQERIPFQNTCWCF